MTTKVKICGINDGAGLRAALAGQASLLGFNFYPPSPRSLTPTAAAALARQVPDAVRKVGVFVDPSDQDLEAVLAELALDMIQLHGSESLQRTAEIRRRFGIEILKALKIEMADDLDFAQEYEGHADMLLFDAKPPSGDGILPGGNGVAFDWQLLKDRSFGLPWMLSGGLKPDNVADAIAISGARMVDVSSGVESRPGKKNPQAIKAFLDAARGL